MTININKDLLTGIAIGYIMATWPVWALATSRDWDEVLKTGSGAGSAGLIVALIAAWPRLKAILKDDESPEDE